MHSQLDSKRFTKVLVAHRNLGGSESSPLPSVAFKKLKMNLHQSSTTKQQLLSTGENCMMVVPARNQARVYAILLKGAKGQGKTTVKLYF